MYVMITGSYNNIKVWRIEESEYFEGRIQNTLLKDLDNIYSDLIQGIKILWMDY